MWARGASTTPDGRRLGDSGGFLAVGANGRVFVDSLSEPRSVKLVTMTAAADVPAATVGPGDPAVKARNPIVRGVFFALGVLSLVGLVFSFLPGIPTADLVVLALFFFARSSPRFEAWLRSRPFIQKVLARYEGGLTRGTKIQATVGIAASLAVSAGLLTDRVAVRSIIGFVGLFAIWFVWSRPSKDSVATPS